MNTTEFDRHVVRGARVSLRYDGSLTGAERIGITGMSAVLHRISVLLLAAIMAAGLGACRKEEQQRPLSYEKGVYSGPKGVELDANQRRQLRNRHRSQSGGSL